MVNLKRKETDKELVDRTLGGDRDAFRDLYQRYRKMVKWAVKRSCGSSEDADDLIQITWTKALANLARFDTSRHFSTWIVTIAWSACMDFRNRYARSGCRFTSIEHGHEIIPDHHDTVAKVLSVEAVDKVKHKIDRLPNRQKDVITLASRGFVQHEIMKELNITKSVCRGRLYLGRRNLEQMLGIEHAAA